MPLSWIHRVFNCLIWTSISKAIPNKHKVLIDAWGFFFVFYIAFLHYFKYLPSMPFLFNWFFFFSSISKNVSLYFFKFCFIFLRVLVLCGCGYCAGFSSIWFVPFFVPFFLMFLAWVVGIATITTSWIWAECLFGWRNTWTVPQCVYKYLFLMMLNNPSQRRRGDKQAKN